MSPDGPGLASPGPPAPPPGPGVRPPFVAPPTDGARQRRWLAVGLATAAALVVCVGGLFGLGSLLVFGSQMILDQSRAAVTDYLSALRAEEFGRAYEQLCDARRQQIDEREFVRSHANEPRIATFTVGDPVLEEHVVVPATVGYDNGTSATVKYVLEQDRSTGEFEVCGEDG
jgi:hypothetical protein